MILEKYFPAVIKIYRNYFYCPCYSRPLGWALGTIYRLL